MPQNYQQPPPAANGSESCYYCWITQYDKCTSNCNQHRAVPRYGNFDIEPSGKMRLRTTEGNQTYTEWCEQQEAKKKRDLLMTHSRYDLIQERKWQWANRKEIEDGYSTASSRAKDSARFASLIEEGVRNGTVSMPEDASPRITRITASASTLTGGGSYASSRPYYYGAERGPDSVLNNGSVAGRGYGGGEVLEIRSCRKPICSEVHYKYAHGSTKVQITPYTVATIPGSRNYRTAVDSHHRNGEGGNAGAEYATSPPANHDQQQHRRSVSASVSRGGAGSGATHHRSSQHQQRGLSPSVSRPRGSSPAVSTNVSRSRSTLGLVTSGYNHSNKEDGIVASQSSRRMVMGSRCTIASDIVESEILSNRYTSAHEMPLPLIFYQ